VAVAVGARRWLVTGAERAAIAHAWRARTGPAATAPDAAAGQA
jgi:hypothetical protein